MHPTLLKLISQHVLSSQDKQHKFQELVNKLPWQADLDRGKILFGDKYAFKLQVLGSESQENGTWLWSWANDASGLQPSLLSAAENLRLFGERHQIPMLCNPYFKLSAVQDGNLIGLIASGACNGDAVFRASYAGGVAFLLIKDENFPQLPPSDFIRIQRVFMEVMLAVPFEHRTGLFYYLRYCGYLPMLEGNFIRVSTPSGQRMEVEFDRDGRFIGMNGTYPGKQKMAVNQEHGRRQTRLDGQR